MQTTSWERRWFELNWFFVVSSLLALVVQHSKVRSPPQFLLLQQTEQKIISNSISLSISCAYLKKRKWKVKKSWKGSAPYLHILFTSLCFFSANLLLNGNWREGKFYFCSPTSVTDPKLFAPNPSASISKCFNSNRQQVIYPSSTAWFRVFQSCLMNMVKHRHLSTLHLFGELSFSSWYFYLFCGAGPSCIYLSEIQTVLQNPLIGCIDQWTRMTLSFSKFRIHQFLICSW